MIFMNKKLISNCLKVFCLKVFSSSAFCPKTLSLLRRGKGEVCACVLFLFLFSSPILPQAETVPANHPVYAFLKEMNLKGALPEYNDVILPLSKKAVISYLEKTDSSRGKLSLTEQEFLDRMKEKFYIKNPVNIADNFPGELYNNLAIDGQKHLYTYSDSTINFYADPLVDYKFIYSDYHKANASLFSYGGNIKGSYNNWLGFSLTGTLGIQFNNRDVSRIDRRVE
jgi:hypothetical protein